MSNPKRGGLTRSESLRGIGVMAPDIAPASSPRYRQGWVDGAKYVMEEFGDGKPLSAIAVVVEAVEDEGKPKAKRFQRKSQPGPRP